MERSDDTSLWLSPGPEWKGIHTHVVRACGCAEGEDVGQDLQSPTLRGLGWWRLSHHRTAIRQPPGFAVKRERTVEDYKLCVLLLEETYSFLLIFNWPKQVTWYILLQWGVPRRREPLEIWVRNRNIYRRFYIPIDIDIYIHRYVLYVRNISYL